MPRDPDQSERIKRLIESWPAWERDAARRELEDARRPQLPLPRVDRSDRRERKDRMG